MDAEVRQHFDEKKRNLWMAKRKKKGKESENLSQIIEMLNKKKYEMCGK